MDAERGVLTEGSAEIGHAQSLLIDAVSGFMQCAEECAGKVSGVVARRQTAVSRTDPVAERMRCLIQPPRLKVETDRLRRRDRKLPLRIDRIVPRQDGDL